MSDDLISRKDLLKELREIMDEPYDDMFLMGVGAAASVVEYKETAFDKEKVRWQLIELRNAEAYRPDPMNKYAEAQSQGRYSAFLESINIVERGGIK